MKTDQPIYVLICELTDNEYLAIADNSDFQIIGHVTIVDAEDCIEIGEYISNHYVSTWCRYDMREATEEEIAQAALNAL